MDKEQFGVEQWVELFRAAGLNDAQMKTWHTHFEKLYPEAHQSFLQWLNIPVDKIAQIRSTYAPKV